MRASLIAVLTAGAAFVAFGQTPAPSSTNQPGADRTFYFAHVSTTQSMQEIATSMRIIVDMSQSSVDEAKKSLIVNGTPDQLALAEWMFTGIDLPAPVPTNFAIHEYRLPSTAVIPQGASENIVRLFYLNRGQSVKEFQEFVTMVRTIGDIRRVFTFNEGRIVALRGSADQAAMADWLINEIEKSAAAARQHSASAQYHIPDNTRERADTIQVFYVGNAASVQSFQEAATLMRTIGDIRRVYTYNTPRAMTVRGTADQLALAAWLFDRVDRPANAAPSPPSSIYNYQAIDSRDNSVQLFYLTHVPTTTDLQKIATQVRMDTNIQHVYMYIEPCVLALRGTADQLAQAERILKQLDPADFPAD